MDQAVFLVTVQQVLVVVLVVKPTGLLGKPMQEKV